jgi:hypothetical protein
MKIVILSLLTITLMVVSCKPEHKEEVELKKLWTLEVIYHDNTVDTLVLEGYNRPTMRIYDGVSIIDNGEFNIEPVASYVKNFKIIEVR